MSTYFDKSKNLRDLADDIVTHLNRTGGGHDVSNEPRVPQGSGPISGEWTKGGGGTQIALGWPFRGKANDYKPGLKNLLDNLTNGTLSDEQLERAINQLLDHIPLSDATKLRDLQGATPPVEITPDQKQIIQRQIDQLSPDLRDIVQKAFDRANTNGTIVCPKCSG